MGGRRIIKFTPEQLRLQAELGLGAPHSRSLEPQGLATNDMIRPRDFDITRSGRGGKDVREFKFQGEDFEEKRTRLIDNNCIFAGINLEPFYPDFGQHYLFCATEKASKEDIDLLVKEVA